MIFRERGKEKGGVVSGIVIVIVDQTAPIRDREKCVAKA